MENLKEKALKMHEEKMGKLKVAGKVKVENEDDLTLAYSPGVAYPCLAIAENSNDVYKYTNKSNFVAIVSNGTAVLGLGNIGADASIPVMEGKSVLFKEFGAIDGFPICLDSEDLEEIINTVKLLEPVFGGINLEDIKAPECFIIEEKLKEEMNIPVFHDDQHGTAIITLGALMNSIKILDKKFKDLKVVINGAGAAGISMAGIIMEKGAENVILLDRCGALYEGRGNMNEIKEKIAKITNPDKEKGKLGDVINGADVFLGVSVANVMTEEMVKDMADDPIVFPMANPDPEIDPELAFKAGARIVGTGRSDYPNQINNVLAFPGIFRGALDVRATDINMEMKLAAAQALADLVSEKELTEEYVIPKPFDSRVGPHVAAAVAEAAVKSGVARIELSYEEAYKKAEEKLGEE
ncbi:NADP-dependent malic enzyme [Halanaerobium saccharolyticum subsp. saccharolyticum DSM 6643]|uniref:NADP-dependent malic enzyme n=1 Tax=Halanaerobium saccharolyticum subsp. saccharolyticum DSM 6643 TaxID=1293054 RepID=M5DZ70_9FIRM|nr:malic enzyme-like NAD(P)-binding protein [Halanaerobium saccharolyticum]CCU78942.1 NADP-dependent malic enzyme [Halanaerobium saccharolyticum subsp. saccharolyticum DSM 6643]